MIVDDVLAEIGGDLVTCGPDVICLEAARLLSRHRIGLLLVCEGEANVGVLSERDIVRMIAEVGEAALSKRVGDVMTKNVVSCEPGRSLSDAVEMMNANAIRHLVIGRAGKIDGVISLHDITRYVERTSTLYEI